MAWSEIEAIFAASVETMRTGATFRTSIKRIRLDLQYETREKQDAAIAFLREKLASCFDVFNRVPERTSIRRILWLLTVASAGTLLFFAVWIVPSFYLPPDQWLLWAAAWGPT